MRILDGIAAYPRQVVRVAIDGGSYARFRFRFHPRVEQWNLDVSWQDQEVNGIRIVASPNMLSQYASRFPFGVLVQVSDGLEPMFINDFVSGRVLIAILSEAEANEIAELFS